MIYLTPGYVEEKALLAKLGPHSSGLSCLYVKRYEDLDKSVLRKLVQRSFARQLKLFPG